MKKSLKITFIVIGVLFGIIVLDTFQAIVFQYSPLLKIRENLDGGSTDYIDKGLFVNYYYCTNGEEHTLLKGTKYSCSVEEKAEFPDPFSQELFQCFENELGGYLVTEIDDFVEIPLDEIKKNDQEKIAYYKGVYASEHPDNMYVIVYPENGTYDFNVMKDFDKYFYEKFSVYQKNESSSSPTVYIHSVHNDVDFDDVMRKCRPSDDLNDGQVLLEQSIDKIKNTKKIVIKANNKELGTIRDADQVMEILNALSSGKKYGELFLCDGSAFDFEMYDADNTLMDTISVWGDGKRFLPKSIHDGCSYYSISNGLDLRKIMEEETNYVFYDIIDFREPDEQRLQLIYQDDRYQYFLKSENTHEVFIKFMLTNQVMSLPYALENKYISAETVASDYPDLFIRE